MVDKGVIVCFFIISCIVVFCCMYSLHVSDLYPGKDEKAYSTAEKIPVKVTLAERIATGKEEKSNDDNDPAFGESTLSPMLQVFSYGQASDQTLRTTNPEVFGNRPRYILFHNLKIPQA